MKTTAVIPVRKDSQRVKDKSIRTFAGTTLLDIKIQMLLRVPEIDEIIINTNSETAIELVGRKYQGTKVKCHRREEYFASSQCSGSDFFKHLGEVTETDVFIYAPCTSPFVREETVSDCIKRYFDNLRNNNGYDCVSTVSLIKEFMWLKGKPVNYNPADAPNSQNLPDIVALNFGTTVISREKLIEKRNIIGDKPDFIITSDVESIDIDTPLDFYIAEQLFVRINVDNKGILDF